MTANRSAQELAMRDAVEAWGRERWPGARVVHELVVGACRIDMAFVCRDHLVGVEIKGPRDTLERVDKQIETFTAGLPEVWLAIDEKWRGQGKVPWTCGRLWCAGGKVAGVDGLWRPVRLEVTVPLLNLLWRDELHAVAVRRGLSAPKSRDPIGKLTPLLARKLTGDEIVTEVCRQLRARDQGRMGKAFWRADPAILEAAA